MGCDSLSGHHASGFQKLGHAEPSVGVGQADHHTG